MKPARFDYVAPTTVADAVSVLSDNFGATVLAGGQSLVPALNFRLGAPELLVDVNRVEGIAGIDDSGGRIRIGALTRHSNVLESPILGATCPLLVAAARHIGHLPIRNRGTVGGSVAHADPAAEIPGVAVALGGVVELSSRRGRREISIGDFALGPYFTAREPDELVTALLIEPLETQVWGFHEIVRSAGDFALAGAAVVLQLDDGAVSSARVALFGVEAAPQRLAFVEEALVGSASRDAPAVAAAAVRDADLEPVEDPQVPQSYRAHLAAVAVERAVADATSQERGA